MCLSCTQLPATITASFVASGPAGSVQNQLDTEYLVQTNVTEIISLNVAFDGYPTGPTGDRSPDPARPTSPRPRWPPSPSFRR